MTNREVIQLFAKYEPELIVRCFESAYCSGLIDGWNDNEERRAPNFPNAGWLDEEYNKEFFGEQDVERLLKVKEEKEVDFVRWRTNDILTKEQAQNFIKAIEACEKDKHYTNDDFEPMHFGMHELED